MATQSFRGAGGAGAVGTPRPGRDRAIRIDAAAAKGAGERRRQAYARGWVLALDVNQRLTEMSGTRSR
jgi:hypothetical protein